MYIFNNFSKIVNLNIKNHKKAFSLVELSVIILIIGIIIAGITKASNLYNLYKLSSARTQTQSSPVNSMKNLLVWYDATSKDAFVENETDDYAGLTAAEKALGKGVISTWYDTSSYSGVKDNLTQTTLGYRPQYLADCINGLPCINFDGDDDFMSFTENKIGNIALSNYTIFIVNKKTSTDGSSEAIIGTNGIEDDVLNIGYESNSKITWGHVAGNYSTSSPASVTLANNDPTLHVFVNEIIDGFSETPADNYFYYTNGSPTKETLVEISEGGGVANSSTEGLLGYDTPTVGGNTYNEENAYYTGGVGEIIIFNRALKSKERDSVEDYLIRKWHITPDNSAFIYLFPLYQLKLHR